MFYKWILVQIKVIKEVIKELIEEGAFAGTYFRDINSGINGKWYRKSWKDFDQLKNIDQRYCCSDYYDVRCQ